MERVEIRKRKDATSNALNTSNFDFIIDGEKQKMSGVKSVKIDLDAMCFPEITFVASPKFFEMDIDGEVKRERKGTIHKGETIIPRKEAGNNG